MPDIQPATDEQIAEWEQLLYKSPEFIEEGEIGPECYRVHDPDCDQLYSSLRMIIPGLIARIRADAEKFAAAEANLTAMTNKAGDEFEHAEAAEARAARLAGFLHYFCDIWHETKRFRNRLPETWDFDGINEMEINACVALSDPNVQISQTENSLMTAAPPSPRPFLLESSWSANELVTLIANALRAERRTAFERAKEIILIQVKRESAGRCCDNCSCQAIKHSLEAIEAEMKKVI